MRQNRISCHATTGAPASSIPGMSWTPDAKTAAVLEQIIKRARARAFRGFREAREQIERDQAARGGPVGYRYLVQARAIVREFGRVTVPELVDVLRKICGGSIPLEALGWVGLALTGEIEKLVKTLGQHIDEVSTTSPMTGAIERLQGARGDATREVETQLGKAALLPPAQGNHRARRRR
jgi:hypothetical protein